MNPYDTPEYSRPGMSGTTKVLLGMGIGCGVLVLLCCGFFGASTFWLVRTAQQALTKDPEEIRRLTDQIVAIKIPESLPPKAGMDLTLPFVGTKFMTWVAYGADESHNGLFLAQFAEGLVKEEDMRTQWRDSMRQSGERDWDDIKVEESDNVEIPVNGSNATFTISKGQDSKSREVWQVMGSFHGKGGPAMLALKVGTADFTREQLFEILNSMK
jgi:hypothetical protein